MVYKYDKTQLIFRKYRVSTILISLASIILIPFVSFYFGFYKGLNQNFEELPYEERYHLIKASNAEEFSRENFIKMLKELNIKFPHIVMAQAIIESGNFQSKIFRSNNNMFGMKQARMRCTTAQGTELNHAYYDTWKEAVYDYALFQSAYLRDLKTESQYLEYLNKNYAEASEYDKAVAQVIKKNNLRELFK